MIVMLIGAVAGLVTAPMLGGKFSRLVHVTVNYGWLILISSLLQALLLGFLYNTFDSLTAGLFYTLSFLPSLFFILLNRHIRFLLLLGIGGLLNLTAVVANQGVMPASPAAYARSGLPTPEGFKNSQATENATLGFLGDIFAIPKGTPLANVFSIGDVVLNLGIILILHELTGSKLIPKRRK
jgi:flagellar biosynthesis protein FliQ